MLMIGCSTPNRFWPFGGCPTERPYYSSERSTTVPLVSEFGKKPLSLSERFRQLANAKCLTWQENGTSAGIANT